MSDISSFFRIKKSMSPQTSSLKTSPYFNKPKPSVQSVFSPPLKPEPEPEPEIEPEPVSKLESELEHKPTQTVIERHISMEYQIDGMSVEQMYAMQLLESGQNMFLTGPGGTGKSFLISKFIDWANENDRDIRVTALTGCAALLLGKTALSLIHI